MLTNIRNVIDKYDMLGKTAQNNTGSFQPIIVALSGGADSVCLLHVLLEMNIPVEACHVNHKLRGESSDSDESFVRALCERLGVNLHVHKIDVKSLKKKHQSLEECAREARYAYFNEIGTNSITATAHTAGDNTETVLLNLIRGTGLRGLCGIPPVRGNMKASSHDRLASSPSDEKTSAIIIRPLIETTREEVLAYLAEKGADYISDESNFSDEFTRNNLRLNIIPLLEKINPSLTAAVTRMCNSLRFDEEYLHGIAVNSDSFKVDFLIKQPPAIKNRIISLLLSKNNISPTNLRINGIASLLESGGAKSALKKINLSKDKFAVVKDNSLNIQIIPQNYRKN
ncbi:MAG: tRNA lysidine(34) synthetase TilS [Oscillospiraceae bacterium]|nr:tRNA lysidine(34) synthetase TilS [Oscillospiraceae bacterium]